VSGRNSPSRTTVRFVASIAMPAYSSVSRCASAGGANRSVGARQFDQMNGLFSSHRHRVERGDLIVGMAAPLSIKMALPCGGAAWERARSVDLGIICRARSDRHPRRAASSALRPVVDAAHVEFVVREAKFQHLAHLRLVVDDRMRARALMWVLSPERKDNGEARVPGLALQFDVRAAFDGAFDDGEAEAEPSAFERCAPR